MLKDYSPRSGEDSNEYQEGQRRPWLGRRSAVLPEGLTKVLIADYCAQESVVSPSAGSLYTLIPRIPGRPSSEVYYFSARAQAKGHKNAPAFRGRAQKAGETTVRKGRRSLKSQSPRGQ
ncbi:hypothetical protein QAD02_000054 [Eretmocerus hayati]|uniref:Uncharacterized protein n=1 Tax=Eretmocerus hayati TaxID=131215 RepID=A0ACC2NCD6_9HYME|nr:hypothetical protein QAD02_000054 [Eretmocerus hayati]